MALVLLLPGIDLAPIPTASPAPVADPLTPDAPRLNLDLFWDGEDAAPLSPGRVDERLGEGDFKSVVVVEGTSTEVVLSSAPPDLVSSGLEDIFSLSR